MIGRPRVDVLQRPIPGAEGEDARLVIHAVTATNFTQRLSIARKGVGQTKWRYVHILLTRAQLYDLVGELDERAGLMSDETPRGTPL